MAHEALKLVTPPGVEPVSVALVKSQARIDADITTEDSLIAVYISAARRYVEGACGRQMITAGYRLTVDCFPSPFGRPYYSGAGAISGIDMQPLLGLDIFDPARSAFKLPNPPLIAVSSITYIDPSGNVQTLDPSTYTVDADSEPGRITPSTGLSWPATKPVIDAVVVNYTAGYGTAGTNVPETYQLAILQLAAHWYTNRASVSPGALNEVPMGTMALVMQDRVKGF